MQTTGYILTKKHGKIKLLARQTKYGWAFKIRKSGADNFYFKSESEWLNDQKDKFKRIVIKKYGDPLERLIKGEVIHL